MGSFLLSTGRFLRDFLVGLLLWGYAALVVFTWHVAFRTPDWAVLIRVAASIFDDLVWIPFGVIIWRQAADDLFRVIRRGMKNPPHARLLLLTAALLFVALFSDAAFRLLLIPLAVTSAFIVRAFIVSRDDLHLSGRVLPLAVIAALTIGHYRTQMIPHTGLTPLGPTIKVMSYNILLEGARKDRYRIVDSIRKENPDIVCCIEFNLETDRELFDRELGSLYPYAIESDRTKGMKSGGIIYSKYPMIRKNLTEGKTRKNDTDNGSNTVFAEIDIDGRRVNVVNYHLKTVGHYIEYIADKKPFGIREKILWAAKYEVKNDSIKYAEAQSLVRTVSAFSGPTILCGDLNDTPNSRAFLTIRKNFRNTFSEKGYGIGATFGEARIREKLAWIPFASFLARDVIRIDHIFISPGLETVSSYVPGGTGGSDHKPVVSVIALDTP
jgi:endonuclease/exonuclease/phosphatase family metal-dependent hydrolase